MTFTTSDLWLRELGARSGDSYEASRARLRLAYSTFWDRAVRVTRTISSELPGLTLHDETHLEALWDRASQLIGSEFQINPLEVFVLGGAILLHDTAHALLAYSGQLAEVKATTEYKDRLAVLRQRASDISEEEASRPPEDWEREALFFALRQLHGKQARVLGTLAFQDQFLIDDNELRTNFGTLIGLIAASHQWDRSKLEELPPRQGSSGSMPEHWTVDPTKLACILRCADAIQIDECRVPSFAFAIQNPRGASRLHWIAQRLRKPIVHQMDAGTGSLSFSSINDFSEQDADAWWIAYDLIEVANNELQGCHQLLNDSGRSTFTVDRVVGAGLPAKLREYIRTDGWIPLNAEVKVTNVNRIVELFGGAQLYGRDPSVPLRELIQNAADAVRARCAWRPDPNYQGKIVVRLAKNKSSDGWLLSVEDNGTGMAKSVLAGTLLEFGKSLWKSDAVHSQFPGLASLNVAQTGKYGIGFFSCFMISKEVTVTSRRFESGYNETFLLAFKDHLNRRPILKQISGSLLGELSTRVDLELSNDDVLTLCNVSNHISRVSIEVPFRQIVSHLCPMLDCDLFVEFHDDSRVSVRRKQWYSEPTDEWLDSILFVKELGDDVTKDYIRRLLPFVQVIKAPDETIIGRAAISFGHRFNTGLACIGPLTVGSMARHLGTLADYYVGCLCYTGDGPKRSAGSNLLFPEVVREWASAQANLMGEGDLSLAEKYLAAINVARFGGNPTPIAGIILGRKIVGIDEIIHVLLSGKILFAPIRPESGAPTSKNRLSQIQYSPTPGMALNLVSEVEVLDDVLEAWEPWVSNGASYYVISGEDENSSFLSCLKTAARSRNLEILIGDPIERVVAVYIGEQSARDKLATGQEILMPCVGLQIVLTPAR